jgi:hypothetical protein
LVGLPIHKKVSHKRITGEAPKEHYKEKQKKIKEEKVDRDVFIPASVRVSDLARIVDVRLCE